MSPLSSRAWIVHGQLRIAGLELPHLAIRAPAPVAVAGSQQIHLGDVLEAAGGIEARGGLASQRLIVDEAVCAGRRDGLLIQALGLQFTTINTCNLGADQRGAVLEVLRAMFGPGLELPMVHRQDFQVRHPLIASDSSDGIDRPR